MVCVDGRNNKWRLDPANPDWPDWMRETQEEALEKFVVDMIKQNGYLPRWIPDAIIKTSITYVLRCHLGSSPILRCNYEVNDIGPDDPDAPPDKPRRLFF